MNNENVMSLYTNFIIYYCFFISYYDPYNFVFLISLVGGFDMTKHLEMSVTNIFGK